MKTIKVVAAVICDSKKNRKSLIQPKNIGNSKVNGNFREEK